MFRNLYFGVFSWPAWRRLAGNSRKGKRLPPVQLPRASAVDAAQSEPAITRSAGRVGGCQDEVCARLACLFSDFRRIPPKPSPGRGLHGLSHRDLKELTVALSASTLHG